MINNNRIDLIKTDENKINDIIDDNTFREIYRNFTEEKALEVINYHKSFPDYEKTPLVSLDNLAKSLNISKLYVKDESKRFSLNAFKILGASFAIREYVKNSLKLDNDITLSTLQSKMVSDFLEDKIFVTATDGNHGRGVAHMAKLLGKRAKVFMPKNTTKDRLLNIKNEGADVEIYPYNYDKCVLLSKEFSRENNGILIQDTAWEGYKEIPLYIMQGYLTLGKEIASDLDKSPTHIFLQAGVGSMAIALSAYFSRVFDNPKIIIVEPKNANCFYLTAKNMDGKLYEVGGELNSIMAGLCCGKPSELGYEILAKFARYYLSVNDEFTKHGMKLLFNPIGDDKKIISGESGAVGVGLISKIMTDSELSDIRNSLDLDENSRVLCISTEGDTDKTSFNRIINE